MHGFKQVEMTDHEIAKYLRDRRAIDNYRFEPSATKWHDDKGNVVLVIFYTGAGGMVTRKFIPA